MELPELQQGLQNIQDAPADNAPPEAAPWELNYDNLMGSYGSWFNNNQGLGEMLLQQLRMRGVDTQAATEAMLRELLQGLVNDMNALQQSLTGFTAMLAQQAQKTQAVADSVSTALAGQNPDAMATQVMPPQGDEMPVMNDIPPDLGGGETPPPEPEPSPNGGEQPLAEGTQEQPPAEPPAEEAPAAEPEKKPEGTPSDKRIKYIVSDATLKNIKSKYANKDMYSISNSILAGCNGGF